jgi:hypothetical protein
MATAQNPSPKIAEGGEAPRASISVTTVSSLEPVQLNEWQKVIKFDSHFEEGEFAIAEFASLQRYNLILLQNKLAKMKAAIAVESDPERQPDNNVPPLNPQVGVSRPNVNVPSLNTQWGEAQPNNSIPQVEVLQETLHHYGTQE